MTPADDDDRDDPDAGDDLLAALLAAGRTWDEAAAAAGVSRATVARRARDPAFRARVAAARRPTVQRALGMLTGVLPDAVAALHLVATDLDAPPAARVAAATRILDQMLRLRGSEDHEERIARLEDQFAAPDHPTARPTRPDGDAP